ncbi:heavy metal-associated isoprenylated plant protein 36 [Ricinus communis]|uniref:Chloroplast-targeted copper chaperone, putative n=1 Tax=Ricinus communis TaxID=3988 RepID=B9RT41_RICCO|nr:heavy metal-associated isoprenylated plant protein 36 [Ricinus communis]EEF45524.1 chloroplast-targeted copper chaperone, putative [Ricinus communis]|eukprot:XP_002516910.1 heavy metal-associated isoprenylated plant protein 36 [Ricinus communis]
MATTTSGLQPSLKALKCQTWVLRVSIHCQGCQRKVKKVLLGIDGVYTAAVDSQQQRVTVTGNIGVETLIKKLIKTGKHAEIWHEKLAPKEKESGKANTMHKQNDPKTDKSNGKKKSVKFSDDTEDAKNVEKSPENSTSRQEKPVVKSKGSENGGGGAKNGGKKKKERGQKGDNSKDDLGEGTPSSGGAAGAVYQTQGMGMDQVVGPSNLSPTRQHPVPFPQGFNISPVYASSYSMANPRENPAPFYYILPPSSPYANPTTYQVTPLDSFYYFSDENVDGCSIM